MMMLMLPMTWWQWVTVAVVMTALANTHWGLLQTSTILHSSHILSPLIFTITPWNTYCLLLILKLRNITDKELTNCEGHTVSARAINTILKDMQWNRSPKQTSTFMVSLYSTRCQETIHWGKNSFSVNGAGTTGYPYEKEWSRPPTSQPI